MSLKNKIVHNFADKPIRIDRLLGNLGICQRKDFYKFQRKNKVEIIGEPVVKSSGHRVFPSHVRLNDKPLQYLQPLTLMLHKPVGYVCSHERDTEDAKLVFDLLPPEFHARTPKVSVAGRLDRWATGLVVASQDGDLVHRIISPKKRQGKRYIVRTVDAFRGDEKELFEKGGIQLKSEAKPCLPAYFETLSANKARITLFEGKYHQLRRMFGSLGHRVDLIHRECVGPLSLGSLQEGSWRLLTEHEISLLSNTSSQDK